MNTIPRFDVMRLIESMRPDYMDTPDGGELFWRAVDTIERLPPHLDNVSKMFERTNGELTRINRQSRRLDMEGLLLSPLLAVGVSVMASNTLTGSVLGIMSLVISHFASTGLTKKADAVRLANEMLGTIRNEEDPKALTSFFAIIDS